MFPLSFLKQLVPFLLHQVSYHASMLQFEQGSLPEESKRGYCTEMLHTLILLLPHGGDQQKLDSVTQQEQ